jgi:hypothetical protein
MKYMAQKVREDAGTTYSFVYQGNQGEGGVVDALEHEWNAGATSSTERGSSYTAPTLRRGSLCGGA